MPPTSLTARRHVITKFRELLEVAPDAMALIDAQGRIMLVNRHFEHLFGYSSDEMYGRDIETLVPSRFRARHIEQRRDFNAAPRTRPMGAGLELYALRKNQSEFPAEISLAPIAGDSGQWVLCAIRDISYRKELEESARKFSGLLLRLQDEDRRRLARDLQDRTSPPLTSLASKLFALKKQGKTLTPAALELLEDSLSLVELASAAIRAISNLLHPPMLDWKGLLTSLQWYLESYIKQTGINVASDLPPTLPTLPAGADIALFRVVQDGLRIISRITGNAAVGVRLLKQNQSLNLEISSLASSQRAATAENGWKEDAEILLSIMRERLREFGGHAEINANRASILISASLPLKRNEESSTAQAGRQAP